MASNSSNNIGTIMGNAAAISPKRGRVRKAAAATETKISARKSSEAAEIVFKELPNPYRAPEPPYIWIDFPQQAEHLNASVYVIRLGVGGAELVELSIDKGDWLPCRFASGYWWYDWSNISIGKHALVARMKVADGRWFRTPPRTCEYRP